MGFTFFFFLEKTSKEVRMADHHHEEDAKAESLIEKTRDKVHGADDSSSSSSDDEGKTSSLKAKVFRLFGREKPVHKLLGGGKRTLFLSSLLHSLTNSPSSSFLLLP